jgi:hypothetical protein
VPTDVTAGWVSRFFSLLPPGPIRCSPPPVPLPPQVQFTQRYDDPSYVGISQFLAAYSLYTYSNR